MKLKDAIEIIWANRKYKAMDPRQVISHLNEEVAESLKALLQGDEEKARHELEDALSCMFIALRVLDVDVVEAIERQTRQMQKVSENEMIIREQEVELRVNGIRKGGWSVWDREDIEQAKRIAKEFGYTVIIEGIEAEK